MPAEIPTAQTVAEAASKSDVPLCSLFDSQIIEIMHGKAPLPNAKPFEFDVGAALIHYREMHCGIAVLPNGKKEWHARFFLDHGQGGGFHGSGLVVWPTWKDGAYRAVGMKFAICNHAPVEGAGANHSRGWHPARCSKCGLDLSVDSGD